jgi:hypothetical protein
VFLNYIYLEETDFSLLYLFLPEESFCFSFFLSESVKKGFENGKIINNKLLLSYLCL